MLHPPRNNEPITGDLVKLGAGIWCENTTSAGELSPQGVVRFEGREGRFDQAVGEGWFILAIETGIEDLLRDTQLEIFDRLDGKVLSVGAEGCDVTTRDNAYINWSSQTGARYAIIRPDFYVAATAGTAEELCACFDTIAERLGLTP